MVVKSGSSNGYPEHNLTGGFKLKKFTEGGVLLDLGSHYLSLVNYIILKLKLNNKNLEIVNSEINNIENNENYVEINSKGIYYLNNLKVEYEFSYEKELNPSICFYEENAKLLEWPFDENLLYSNLAFKNMITSFIEKSYFDNKIIHPDYTTYLESINKTILINSLYRNIKY